MKFTSSLLSSWREVYEALPCPPPLLLLYDSTTEIGHRLKSNIHTNLRNIRVELEERGVLMLVAMSVVVAVTVVVVMRRRRRRMNRKRDRANYRHQHRHKVSFGPKEEEEEDRRAKKRALSSFSSLSTASRLLTRTLTPAALVHNKEHHTTVRLCLFIAISLPVPGKLTPPLHRQQQQESPRGGSRTESGVVQRSRSRADTTEVAPSSPPGSAQSPTHPNTYHTTSAIDSSSSCVLGLPSPPSAFTKAEIRAQIDAIATKVASHSGSIASLRSQQEETLTQVRSLCDCQGSLNEQMAMIASLMSSYVAQINEIKDVYQQMSRFVGNQRDDGGEGDGESREKIARVQHLLGKDKNTARQTYALNSFPLKGGDEDAHGSGGGSNSNSSSSSSSEERKS